jgi:hypothetical protein
MSAAGMTSAVLRPQGQRQQNGNRRNGHQATHTAIIDPHATAVLSSESNIEMGVDDPWEASVPTGQPNLRTKVRKLVRKLAA